jgi:crotonobetainyl-CoA:carnitine CoA-transferase CaiB-like acyl-CoA transferase
MNEVLKGIRIVEVAQYVFVPVATAVLAEWGADVIKIEHPTRGDAYRGLRRTGNLSTAGTVHYAVEHANRCKRSLGLDLSHAEGRSTFGKLLATADVLVTNLLPDSRTRLGLELEQVRRDNPKIIYARGTALGERGPERLRGGYDHASFWARTGSQMGSTPQGAQRPSPMPSGAFGDSTAGLALAGGIAAALLNRERTGEPTTVDLSLLGMGMWSMASAITGSMMNGESAEPMPRVPAFNPLAGTYRSRDGRWIVLGLLQGFHQWPDLCRAIAREEWIEDQRFSTGDAFERHLTEVETLLDDLFATEAASHWRDALSHLDAVWEIAQDTLEVAKDPQALANGYVAEVEASNASTFRMISSPVQFAEQANRPRRAPDAGEHTEQILEEMGLDWDEISRLKSEGAIS